MTSASSKISLNGVRIALEDDTVSCPACQSTGVIKLDGPRLSQTWNGRQVALNDDLCICKCSPPPRLVNNQTFKSQIINADWQVAQAFTAAETVAKLNTAESSAAAPDGTPLVLLDPDTQEPFKHRPYRLELTDKVIEGTTDQYGATRPLTAAERALVLTWHVEGQIGAA